MQEVYEFLKKCNTYYIATVEGDQPRVRPFGTILIFENKLYIQSGKIKNFAKQLAANPKCEICAMGEGKWIRVAGTLVMDERIEPQQAMLDDYPSLQNMYKAGDGNNVVVVTELPEAPAAAVALAAAPAAEAAPAEARAEEAAPVRGRSLRAAQDHRKGSQRDCGGVSGL